MRSEAVSMLCAAAMMHSSVTAPVVGTARTDWRKPKSKAIKRKTKLAKQSRKRNRK